MIKLNRDQFVKKVIKSKMYTINGAHALYDYLEYNPVRTMNDVYTKFKESTKANDRGKMVCQFDGGFIHKVG